MNKFCRELGRNIHSVPNSTLFNVVLLTASLFKREPLVAMQLRPLSNVLLFAGLFRKVKICRIKRRSQGYTEACTLIRHRWIKTGSVSNTHCVKEFSSSAQKVNTGCSTNRYVLGSVSITGLKLCYNEEELDLISDSVICPF